MSLLTRARWVIFSGKIYSRCQNSKRESTCQNPMIAWVINYFRGAQPANYMRGAENKLVVFLLDSYALR